MRSITTTTAIVITAALLAASCGGGVDDSGEPVADAPTDSAAAADDAATNDTTPDASSDDAVEPTGGATENTTDAPAVEPNGTLRYGTSLGVQWDPHNEPRAFAMAYYTAAYDGLVNETPDGEIVAGLATEWEITDTEARFTLREGVVFHDGTPFDADAVVYSIEKAKATPGAVGQGLATVESVEATTPTEVVMTLSSPDRDLLNVLARQAGMIISPSVDPTDVAAGVPAGTGPYRLTSVTQDRYVLEPTPDYWDPSQQGLEGLEYTVLVDDDARLNALRTGELDVASLRAGQVADVESAGFAISSAVTNISIFQVIDVDGESNPSLADPDVRIGLAHAIDREAWGNAVARGVGSPTNQLFVEDTPWFLDDFEGYAYDPELARELLSGAGVSGLTVSTASWGPFDPGNQVLQAMFADVGVTMDIDTVAPGADIAAIQALEVPVNYTFMPETHPDGFFSKHLAAPSTFNPFGGTVEGVVENRDIAAGAADEDESNAAYRDMLSDVYESAWVVPIWTNEGLIGYDAEAFPDLRGWRQVVLGINIRGLSASS